VAGRSSQETSHPLWAVKARLYLGAIRSDNETIRKKHWWNDDLDELQTQIIETITTWRRIELICTAINGNR